MKKLHKLILGIAWLLACNCTYAIDLDGANFSAMAGYARQNSGGNGYGAFEWGARAGYAITTRIEAAVSYQAMHSCESMAAAYDIGQKTTNLQLILSEFDYHFIGPSEGLYIGALLGLGILAQDLNYEGSDLSLIKSGNFAYGAAIGYDVPIAYGLSAGPKIQYVGAITSPEVVSFHMLGTLRYSF